jgi:hypothetical protein
MAILINDTAPRSQYTATSSQTVFTVPFEFFENADLKVYKNSTLLTLTTNYTVTGAGVTGGGSVTLVTGATAGDIVTIVRDVAVKRVTDFPTSGPFNVEALNTDLDRLTAMVQQQETLDTRSLRLDQFDTPNSFDTLPVKASRVGRVLQFNSSTGQPEAGPTTSEVANAQTYATNASTSATASAASAATSSAAATSTAGSVAAAAASASAASSSASAASTSASNAATSATAATTNGAAQVTLAAAQVALATTQASNAATSASGASTSASTATTQASTATTQASNAATSASAASTSATAAATAKTAAESARDATLAAYDSFDDRYLGVKSSNPTLDNDGNALVAGSLYFSSTSNGMFVYTGSAWVSAYVSGTGFLATSNNLSELTATASTARTNIGLGTAATMTGPAGTIVGTTDTQTLTNKTLTSPIIATHIGGTAASSTLTLQATSGVGTSDAIILQTGSQVERMRVNTSGNVGIGTTSPAYPLDVYGIVGIKDSESLSWKGGSQLSAAIVGTGSSSYLSFWTSVNERFRIGSSGQLGIGGATYGTSGQVLTSGGASAAPTWTTPTGGFSNLQVFSASGTFTVPAGITKVKVTVVGGGGGGAGGISGSYQGNGGGAGGASIKIISGLTPAGTVTVTVGTGGTAGSAGANAGGSGNTSSFGAYCSATGGAGGQNSSVSTASAAGGVGSSGDLNIQGSASTSGSITDSYPSPGASSILGGGGACTAGAAGSTGGAYGGGGGGGYGISGINRAGGAGGAGVVIVEY